MLRKIYFFLAIIAGSMVALYSQSCPNITDILGNTSVRLDCSHPFLKSSDKKYFTIQSNFLPVHNTNSYGSVETIPYLPQGNMNEGTALNIYKDDEYIKKIDFNSLGTLPFAFSFFGKTQNSITISSNGFITFNDDIKEGDFSTPDIKNQTIPNPLLPPASVFGVMQDLLFSTRNGGEIYYKLEGSVPCRKLIINFYNGTLIGSDQTSSSQIVLYEGTNVIEIYVDSKPLPNSSVKTKESLIGIVDESGNGFAPSNRNTGIWAASKEAYRFSPNGELVTPTIDWYDASNVLLQKDKNSLDVYKIIDDRYIAKANYKFSNTDVFVLADEIDITLDKSLPIAKDAVVTICDTNSQNILQKNFYSNVSVQTDVSYFKFKYYLNKNDAEANNSNFLPVDQPIQPDINYFVRIENNLNPNCYDVAKLKIIKIDDILLTNKVEICDIQNDGIEKKFTLSKFKCLLIPDSFTNYTKIEYFVDNTTNSLVVADLTANSKIYIRITTPFCTKILGPISVSLIAPPPSSSEDIIFLSEYEICDVVGEKNPPLIEPFKWQVELEKKGIILTSATNITDTTFHYTELDAINKRTPLETIKEGLEEEDYTYDVFARLEFDINCAGKCFTIVKFKAKVIFSKIILNVDDNDIDKKDKDGVEIPDDPLVFDTEDADIYLCSDTDTSVNIRDDANRIIKLITPTGLSPTFHATLKAAEDPEDLGITDDVQMILYKGKVNVLAKSFFVKYSISDSCYVTKKLNYHFVKPIAINSKIEICSENSTSPQTVILKDYISTIITSQNNQSPPPDVHFFSDSDANQEIFEITIGKSTPPVYIKIKSNLTDADCEYIYPIEFSSISNEGVIAEAATVELTCDYNNDAEEKINLKNYLGFLLDPNSINSSTTVTFFRNYNPVNQGFSNVISNAESENFLIDKTTTFYIRLQRKGVVGIICTSKLELTIKINFNQEGQVKLEPKSTLVVCKKVSEDRVEFDLNDSVSQLYKETENPPFLEYITSVKYYENEKDANSGANNFISNFQNYILSANTPTKTVYARYESKTGCYSVAPIFLRIIGTVKFYNGLSVEICDENLDQLYQFNLRDWIDSITKDDEISNDPVTDHDAGFFATYTFYKNNTDYNNGISLTPDEEKQFVADPITQNSIIIKAEVKGGCIDYTILKFNIRKASNVQHYDISVCDKDSDGIELINLKQFELPNTQYTYYEKLNDLQQNQNAISFTPENLYSFDTKANISQIYVKISSGNNCTQLMTIGILLKPLPTFTLPNYYFCPNGKVDIQPDFSTLTPLEITKYSWEDPSGKIIPDTNQLLNVKIAGTYKLTVEASNGCSNTITFNVLSYEVPIINKLTIIGNSCTVEASGSKQILYSIDKENWQTNNTFNNLKPGIITFYVKFVNEDCLGNSKEGLVLDINNAFSPNGDGINEYWKIDNLNVFENQNSLVQIFDKNQALVFQQQSNTSIVWDGKSGGKPLPTSTYWYVLKLPDGRIFTGWILLKNRN